jgi:hypothetical protein
MRTERILQVYRAFFVAVIIALSVQTLLHAKGLADHHFWLATIEIVASLLFLFRKTQRVGLPLLLAVFSVAIFLNVQNGGLPFGLVLFGASAVTIVLLDGAIR